MSNHITITQHEYDSDTIDIVPIEPSIREGEYLRTSMRHPDGAKTLTRFPPQKLADPFITGDTQLPCLLTCQVGNWSGSPQPSFTFQWMADGVDIPGFTNYRENFDGSYDAQNITCEVRAFSSMGENYGFTDPVLVTLTEPIEVFDWDKHVITGLETRDAMTAYKDTTIITSGMGAPNRIDTMRGVGYFVTGRSADQRNDVNAMSVYALQGIATDLLHMQQHPGLAIISPNYDPVSLVDDEYQDIQIKNPNADVGTNFWNQFNTNYPIYTTDLYHWVPPNDTSPSEDNVPYNYMYQVLDLPSEWNADIDTGTTNCIFTWAQWTDYGDAQANVKLEFYDANDNLVGTESGPGLNMIGQDVWVYRDCIGNLPIGTRKIYLYIEWLWQSGDDIRCYVDSITGKIIKGNIPTTRTENEGPNYDHWRIRFTGVNQSNEGALGELEFRSSVGGANLATGGTPIAGSVGNGGQLAYAFDGLRNQFYWAGEQDAISKGTSWVGYQFPTSVKPAEIDITARLGSFANQAGSAMCLEGSNNGQTWIKVQDYPDIGTFNSLQQKQFEVLSGTTDFIFNVYPSSISATTSGLGNYDYPSKGSVYVANARLTLKELKVHFGGSDDFDYRLYVMKGLESNSGYAITDILYESGDLNSPVGTTENTVTLPDIEIEVGEEFILAFQDYDLANNPNTDSGSWRDPTRHGRLSEQTLDNNKITPWATWTRPWRSYVLTPFEVGGPEGVTMGDYNAHYFAIDFKAEIY